MTLFPRRCKWSTCALSTRHPSGYCDEHAGKRAAVTRPLLRAARDTDKRARDKAFYDSAAWRKCRAAKLARDPVCELRLPGCTTQARLVNHKVPRAQGGADFDPENLQSACWECHSVLTARKDGGFGYRPRQEA